MFDGHVYVISNGVLKCGSAESGKKLWELRLGGKYWATPVIAGGLLYAVNQDGQAKVVKLDDQGDVIGKGDCGETVMGTPAVSGNALFVRSEHHLWKISTQ